MVEERTYNVGYSPCLNELKVNLRVTSGDLDQQLTQCLLSAISAAEGYIGRVIALSTFVVSGDFRTCVPLRRPVTGIESVLVDGEPYTGYTVSRGALHLGDDVEGETVEVTYTAGFVQVPDDMKGAILLQAGALFNTPVDSVESLPKASTNLLRRYRHYGE